MRAPFLLLALLLSGSSFACTDQRCGQTCTSSRESYALHDDGVATFAYSDGAPHTAAIALTDTATATCRLARSSAPIGSPLPLEID